MTPEWLKMKEQDQVRVRDQKICEEKAIEKLLQEKRLKVISKGEECDYQRILCIAREEMEEKENLTREKRMNEQAHWELEWTEKLAEEVSGLKNEETLKRKQRQLLRSTSLEIRQLEKQLRNAYNAKSLQIQLKEREAIRANTRCQELQQDKAIKGWYQNDHSQQDNFVEAHQKRERYRQDLKKQLIMNCQIKKNIKSKEKETDRKFREEITKVLKEKEAKEFREKQEMIIRLKAEEEAFRKAKEISKSEEKKIQLDEHNRNERIIAEKENWIRTINEIKIKELQAGKIMREKMAEKLLGEEKKRMEREDIINTLHEEEKKISMQAKLRKQSLEKQRLAKELLEDMLRQKKAINERKAKKIALDNDFTQYIVEQNRIDIKQEQDKIQERRLRDLLCGEALKTEIERKNMLKIEEKRRKKESICNDKKSENVKKREIFEEYSRILQLNAPKLEGFLPSLKKISIENFENISKPMYVS